MKRILPGACAISFVLLNPVAMSSAQALQFEVPAGFASVTGIVKRLEAAGLVIQRMEDGRQGRIFPNVRASVFIETDRGDLKVAAFANDAQAERTSVTYTRDTRRGLHEYRLDGIGPRMGITVMSGVPLYFTIERAWLIETRDGALDVLIKRALGQTSDEPQETGRVPR